MFMKNYILFQYNFRIFIILFFSRQISHSSGKIVFCKSRNQTTTFFPRGHKWFVEYLYTRGESESWGLCYSWGVDPRRNNPAKFEPDSSIYRRDTAMQSCHTIWTASTKKSKIYYFGLTTPTSARAVRPRTFQTRSRPSIHPPCGAVSCCNMRGDAS